ncbi:FAD-dependent oxidoreductase [soil metagenome]
MALAISLGQAGLSATVIEQRRRGDPPSIKSNHISARSMEMFRRLGLVPALRGAGMPDDYPNDVAYRTTMVGPELTRIEIPCRRDRYIATGGPDTGWATPEPPHRVNQIFMEPVLLDAMVATPGITFLDEAGFESLEQDADGVSATATRGGETLHFRAKYLVGCDGGRSNVRRQIGAKLSGDAIVQRAQATYIRAPELLGRMSTKRAWANFSMNPRRSGNVYAIDGRETWLVHNYMRDDEPEFGSVDRLPALREILGVDADFPFEVLHTEDWFGRRLTVDKLREGRVFLAGDAAHLWVPYAGYGMNAGLADANDLGWQLIGLVKGWAGPAMLDAYERERLPITEQVSHFAMSHSEKMAKQRGAIPANIEDDTPEGAAARAEMGERAYRLNVQQYCCEGLNFGYYYDQSPVIAYDGERAPEYGMGEYTPSTVPGCRMPHFWLGKGRSLYDALGEAYTLVRFDASRDVAPLETAMRANGVPLAIVDADRTEQPGLFAHDLFLVRPDQHVAWRGDNIPAGAEALVQLLRGGGEPSQSPVAGREGSF